MKPAEISCPHTSIDDLDRDIRGLCKRINAATYELLVLVREFDERLGFYQWGLHSSVEWLAWRCDMSRTTAKEKVRVAHALKYLPAIAAAFESGELSYTKVRELTRVAAKDNEDALLEFALRTTASNVAERCRELRMGDEQSIGMAERALGSRSLRLRHDRQRGTTMVSIEVPMDTGELLEKALDKARDDESTTIPDLPDLSWSMRQADAFVNLLHGYLFDDKAGNQSSNDNHLVTVHVQQSALEGRGGRSALPIETVKRLCCDSQAVVITETDEGEPLNIGRKSRTVPKAIARAVRARDNHRCTFPGCDNSRFLDCHHVEHWSRGGETSLDNLVLLCTKHHTAVHEGGFRIDRDYQNRWVFVRPDGIAIPDNGYCPEDLSDPYKEAPAGALLSKLENRAEEPPPPLYLH